MVFTNDKFEITSSGNSILRIKIFNEAEIGLADAEIMHENLHKLSGGNKFYVLLVTEGQFTSTPEARALVGGKEYSSSRIASAFVVNSIANRLVGNFFIQFHKPVNPTKLFSDEVSAMEWLKEQKTIFDSSNQ